MPFARMEHAPASRQCPFAPLRSSQTASEGTRSRAYIMMRAQLVSTQLEVAEVANATTRLILQSTSRGQRLNSAPRSENLIES